jgi:hypothetical protein
MAGRVVSITLRRAPGPRLARREALSPAPHPTPRSGPRCRRARRSVCAFRVARCATAPISACPSGTSRSMTRKSRSLPGRASPRACEPNKITRTGEPAVSASVRAARSMSASMTITLTDSAGARESDGTLSSFRFRPHAVRAVDQNKCYGRKNRIAVGSWCERGRRCDLATEVSAAT